MSYVHAFLDHPTWFALAGIIAILLVLRLKHVKFGRGNAFFEMAFGGSPPDESPKAKRMPPVSDAAKYL